MTFGLLPGSGLCTLAVWELSRFLGHCCKDLYSCPGHLARTSSGGAHSPVGWGGHPGPRVSSYSTHGRGVGFCWETHRLKGPYFLLETVCCQSSSQWFVGDLLPAFLEAFRIFFFLLFRNFTNLGGALFYICCSVFFPVSPAQG